MVGFIGAKEKKGRGSWQFSTGALNPNNLHIQYKFLNIALPGWDTGHSRVEPRISVEIKAQVDRSRLRLEPQILFHHTVSDFVMSTFTSLIQWYHGYFQKQGFVQAANSEDENLTERGKESWIHTVKGLGQSRLHFSSNRFPIWTKILAKNAECYHIGWVSQVHWHNKKTPM